MMTMESEIYILEVMVTILFSIIGIRYLFSNEIDKSFCGFTCLCVSVLLWGNMAYVSCWDIIFDNRIYNFEELARISVVMFVLFSVFIGLKILGELKLDFDFDRFTMYCSYVMNYTIVVYLGKGIFNKLNAMSAQTDMIIYVNDGVMGSYNDLILRTIPIIIIVGILINVGYRYKEYKDKNVEVEK